MKHIIFYLLTAFVAMTTEAQEKATFGGGCFWCTEAVFEQLKGVTQVESGYSGGQLANPTYREVCSGLTGHAEVVQITYDPEQVAYADLLEVFFATHDPTTLNRQGADVGSQYRSVIFYHSVKQKEMAEEVISHLNQEKVFNTPIVTEISPFDQFYRAEDYHQEYFVNNPAQPYCRAVIVPKMEKFKKLFRAKIKKDE